MGLSQYSITASIKYATGKAGNYGSASNRYLHLWSTMPDQDGKSGVAIAAGWYSEQRCDDKFATISTSATEIINDTVISFTTSASSTASIAGWSIHEGTSTSSNMLRRVEYGSPVAVSTAASVQFTTGSLTVKSTG